MLRYTEEEFAAIKQAARDAGLTPTGYAAEAALAAAVGSDAPITAPWRSAMRELMDARAQVRRIGVNINQASRAINATGEPPVWLDHALVITARAANRLDAAAGRTIRRRRPRPRTKLVVDRQDRDRPHAPPADGGCSCGSRLDDNAPRRSAHEGGSAWHPAPDRSPTSSGPLSGCA